ASTAGIAPATSTFAGWRSDLTELRGQSGIRDRTCTDLASQALPVRCPEETFASRKAVARLERPAARAALHSRTEMVPEVGIAPTSPRLQRGLICLSYSGNVLAEPSSPSEGWSSRQVTLLRLPVISRVLCF